MDGRLWGICLLFSRLLLQAIRLENEMRINFSSAFAASVGFGVVGCSDFHVPSTSDIQFTSARVVLLNFEFDSKIVLSSNLKPDEAIQEQLLYTIGQLNDISTITGKGGVGRLDATEITNVRNEPLPNGKFLFQYHAKIPVGWSNIDNIPTSFTFKLPLDFTFLGSRSFVKKYAATCMDLWSGHSGLTSDDFWYYYRPTAANCKMDDSDIAVAEANVSLSDESTKGKYPEYDMIWKDGALNVIVIFGRDEAGSTDVTDFGIAQYALFNYKLRHADFDVTLKPTPENIMLAPGAESPDVEWKGVFSDGRKIRINTLLIDNPQNTTSQFDTRYSDLTKSADVIIYNGHAALGDNVRALSRKGVFVPGQYTIVSMMGCDSFAYVDGFMAKQRALLNSDDPNGTKYLDMITNVTPTNPTKLSGAALELIRALADPSKPKTYQQILSQYEPDHFAVVTGEEDNRYQPGQL